MASFASDYPTSSAAGTVFLSYAHEDTAAARRIAEALRGFGVEVWFDQGELRSSDAWDEKIRGEIRACTKARREGCFRREWKLAVERTNDMASGVPFIVPVVIDDTAVSEAETNDSLNLVPFVSDSDEVLKKAESQFGCSVT